MKRIVQGKLYDTKTAQEIASWDNSLGRGDFGHCSERLFKTPKGAFFLAGEGGALTRWSEPVGNMRAGGSGIVPLSPEEALTWCETHGVDADTIAEHFDIDDA